MTNSSWVRLPFATLYLAGLALAVSACTNGKLNFVCPTCKAPLPLANNSMPQWSAGAVTQTSADFMIRGTVGAISATVQSSTSFKVLSPTRVAP